MHKVVAERQFPRNFATHGTSVKVRVTKKGIYQAAFQLGCF